MIGLFFMIFYVPRLLFDHCSTVLIRYFNHSSKNRASVYERLSIIKISSLPFPWLQAPLNLITKDTEHPEGCELWSFCFWNDTSEASAIAFDFFLIFLFIFLNLFKSFLDHPEPLLSEGFIGYRWRTWRTEVENMTHRGGEHDAQRWRTWRTDGRNIDFTPFYR